jgi:stage II sporulation protein D
VVATGSGPLQVVGLGLYRGSLEFRPDGGGGVQTVDALGLDDYVRGVISAEMPASWPAQALEAQAVAARTYAITTSVAGNGYTLYPDTRSQMYGGVAAETPATDAAVAATSGQVVTYNGSPVTTYFFSSSGGHTENVEDAWAGAAAAPWLRGVPDPYDSAGGQNPYYRWSFNLSLTSAAAKLRGLVRGGFIGIRVLRHGASPRIVLAAVVGSAGSVNVDGNRLAGAFGLMSTWASFTTISTSAGRGPVHQSRRHGSRSKHGSGSQPPGSPSGGTGLGTAASGSASGGAGISSFLWSMHALSAATSPALHGFVFPARRGDTVEVQRRVGRTWANVARVRLDSNGAYSLGLGGHGTYRVVYRGLDGPAVGV